MRLIEQSLIDFGFLTRLDFCILYFIAGVAGIGYGIKKKNRLIVLFAGTVSVIFGLVIFAGIILINGID